MVESFPAGGQQGIVPFQYELVEYLSAIYVEGSPSHLSAEDSDVLGFTVGGSYSLIEILLAADAYVRLAGRENEEPFPIQPRQGVIKEFR